MFFGKIISCKCDLHIKLNILNPLNIIFLPNGLKMNLLPCNPFFQNFTILKFLCDLVFHKVHPMNMYFYKRRNILLYKKFEINCMILCIPFNYFIKKCNLNI
jgi:hypothetical protein